jgi:hypothetical protein
MKFPSYPKIQNIYQMRAEDIAGKQFVVQVKRDGSNVGVWMDDAGELQLFTRNQNPARGDIYKTLDACEHRDALVNYFVGQGRDDVLFIELMVKGKSPARYEVNDEPSFALFDVWSDGKFQSPRLIPLASYTFKIPCVQTIGVVWGDAIQEEYWLNHSMPWEGVVFKEVACDPMMFKLKHPKPEPTNKRERSLEKPLLPEDEVYSTVFKTLMDMPREDRHVVSKAMPLVGAAIAKECSEQGARVKNLIRYYNEVVKELP